MAVYWKYGSAGSNPNANAPQITTITRLLRFIHREEPKAVYLTSNAAQVGDSLAGVADRVSAQRVSDQMNLFRVDGEIRLQRVQHSPVSITTTEISQL